MTLTSNSNNAIDGDKKYTNQQQQNIVNAATTIDSGNNNIDETYQNLILSYDFFC